MTMQNWHLLYNTTTGESVSIGTVIADPLPAGITALPLTDAEGEGMQNGTLIWDAATRTLIHTPPPAVTAAEWVEQHLTSTQLHALSDLRLSLVLAGKPLGPLMQSLRDWTSQLIVASAADPSPRNDWPPAPCSYADASNEAIAGLNPLAP
jgi:hypothetical protein